METVTALSTAIDQHLLETDQVEEFQARPVDLPHGLARHPTKELFRLARAEARHRRVPPEIRQQINQIYRRARLPLRVRNRVAHSRTYMENGLVFGLSPIERAKADERYTAIVLDTRPDEMGSAKFRSRVKNEVWRQTEALPLNDLTAASETLDRLTLELRKSARALFDQTFGTPDVLFPGILDREGRPLSQPTE